MHTRPGLKEKLVEDIKSCVQKLLADTENQIELGPQAAMYGMVSAFESEAARLCRSNRVPLLAQAEAVPDKSLINVFVNQYLDSYYSTKG